MILSLNHLNKFLPKIKLNHLEVEKALNNLGFEVESNKPFSNVEGLLFGQVLEVFQNPNSDRLDVVILNTKIGQLTIQTTNRILQPGNLIVCFPEGSKKGDTTFKTVKLKDYPSQGMMAAWSEIGYDWTLLDQKDQLLVLPNDFANINDDPMEKLGLNDYLIEISITANRNDANSYYVIAKELASYFNTEFNFALSEPQNTFESKFKAENGLSNGLSFLEVNGNKEISIYEKTLLAKHNISSLFDWSVNLTNLVLINFGIPAHVYNTNKLKSKNLNSNLYSGNLNILGNKEVNVLDVLCIYNDNQPISIASVMGLENTKTDLNSNNYLFEIGVFDPKYIRHGSKEIKITSNSSNQGSRPITHYMANLAMKYIQSYCSELETSNIINEIKVPKNKIIKWDKEKLSLYAGFDILNNKKSQEVIKKLNELGFEFDNDNIIIPEYRYDINLFEDIIEEFFRFYSYDNFIPEPIRNLPVIIYKNDINKKILQHQGYSEVRTFSLISKEKNKINVFGFDKDINLLTFVSKERESIRNSIVTSLQEVIEYNQKRKINQVNIFEKGMINNNHIVYGLASTTKSFNEIKQDIINFLSLDIDFVPLKDNSYIHPNVSAYIYYKRELIGWIGRIHPKHDVTNGFYAEFFDINLESKIQYENINTEPLKSVDLTFELQNNEYINPIIKDLKCRGNIYSIEQVDDFKKENSHNVTLRITADNQTIVNLNEKFNK
ncbi:phenylalanine--tRNA ligase subunit beta [Mycoplasmopsis felis]|uniref:phenylalanine--tRNA ligase subunit beta n=2 Tax=Mycoplasmopsis felis TaxID=33923 RepID=UPI002AFDFBDF|nr:phenylalanine--tRNA ligase subunit beta [Mycoplasmopsis felis]WQQ08338.1 phenylalanine--tRNA ligase subunit beta [Mycoplasmopsis felis]